MKYSLLCTAIAASLYATTPAVLAADPVKPPVHSELYNATFSALYELQAADDARLPMVKRLDQLQSFRHSPAIADQLLKVYGTDHPFTVSRVPAPDGLPAYRFTLMPLHYKGPDGMAADWAEASLDLQLDKSGRNLTVRGIWPSLDLGDELMKMSLRNMTLTGTQYQGTGGLWFGNAALDLASFAIQPKTAQPMSLEGVHMDTLFSDRGKTVEIRINFGIKSVDAAGQKVDDVRMALRFTNLDKQAMVNMKLAGEKNKAKLAGLTTEQRAKAVEPMIKDFLRALALRGAAIEVDDFSAGFGGNRASVKGRINLQGVGQADLASIPALTKKVVGRFDVRVPLALVRDIAGGIARQQLAAQKGAAADPQAAAQVAQTITDVIVGKLVTGGFARVENDMIVSTVELRGGKLLANGKEVSLPKPQPVPGAPAAGPEQFLQARRVDDACRLPDYPAEVVSQDAPLALTLRFVVGTDGHLSKLAVAQPSRWPEYDQAVLAAAATCTYIPALSNGKPVAVPMQWRVVRDPGTTHP